MNELIYKALGDSLTKGTGTFFSKGFVSRYARIAVNEIGRPIRTEIISSNKILSRDLLYMLQDEDVQSKLMYGNIFTITIGGNDLLTANRIFEQTLNPKIFEEVEQEFHQNISAILADITFAKLLFPTPYYIRLVGLYNPLPQLQHSDFWVNRFNQILMSFNSPHVQYVNIYTPFFHGGKQLLSFGGLHPNRHGYQIMAEQTAKVGFDPFA